MSFSLETKNELAHVEPDKKCCMLAEIAGFIRMCGSIRLAGGGKFRIVTTTENPAVAISGEWFTAHGIGENLGHVLLEENRAVMAVLRTAFAAWYSNGHTNEEDPNTCLLKIRLTDGVLFSNGTRYDIDFT